MLRAFIRVRERVYEHFVGRENKKKLITIIKIILTIVVRTRERRVRFSAPAKHNARLRPRFHRITLLPGAGKSHIRFECDVR